MAWKEKHNFILKNKVDIVKKYKEGVTIKEIADIYKITESSIRHNIKLWGLLKRHGIKYLLSKCLSEM